MVTQHMKTSYPRKQGNSGTVRMCGQVPKLVETGHDSTVAKLWNEQYELTEPSVTVNRTA